jgi:hypothetical protein
MNAKVISIESVPGVRGGGMIESTGRSKFKYGTFDPL